MLFVKTTDQQSGKEVRLRYQEYGSGKPVVFIHGWPLTGDMFEYQMEYLSREGAALYRLRPAGLRLQL